MNIQEKLQERVGLIKQQEDVLNLCAKEKRNMTVDEKSTFDNLDAKIGEIEETANREKKFQARVSSLDNSYKEFDPNTEPAKKQDSFQSFGEFLHAVACAGSPSGRFKNAGTIDPRLIQNAATGASANVPADGGFLISPTRSNEIMKKVFEGGTILSACSQFEIGDNSDSLEVPYVEETSRVSGSRWGGLRAYREGEVDPATGSNIKLGLWECRVSDLKILSYVTERLLNDAPALEALYNDTVPQEFTFKLEDEILNGTGGAQCQAVVGHASTVSVAKESGQVAATILAQNIINMYCRSWGRSRPKAAWYINQDIEPQLFTMVLSAGTSGVPIFMPANGLASSPYNTLLGKSIIPAEQCQTLGTVGDIIFADFSEYAIVRKGGIKAASSIHVKFVYDEMTFKWSMRVNGKSKWKKVLTPFKGASTLSPVVTLDTRG
jgi:HK97 family phage major capsid protein